MSQDLFTAFGGEDPPQSRSERILPLAHDGPQQIWSGESVPEPPKPYTLEGFRIQGANDAGPIELPLDDADDFGDFEDASTSTAPASSLRNSLTNVSEPYPAQLYAKSDTQFLPKASPGTSKSLPPRPEGRHEKVGQHPFAGHMDLLFEAGDDEYDAGNDELGDLSSNPEAAMAYSKRIIAEQEAAQKAEGNARPQIQSAFKPAVIPKQESKALTGQDQTVRSRRLPPKDPNVLFDAENLSDDEDEFGNFEAGQEHAATLINVPDSRRTFSQDSMQAIDMLGLGDPPKPVSTTKPSDTISPIRATVSDHGLKLNQFGSRPFEQEDDTWDDFEVAPPQEQPPTLAASASRIHLQTTKDDSLSDRTVPPTNVPPPVILLSMFPSLFASADEALFNTMNKLDLKQRQILLAHPASHQFLRGYLSHCTALAHIIAGRKLRWKRDQHLSQSMRIGPAVTGGKGGMKLTGLDKTELAKEDREVVEVLRLWKVQVGKLRTAVTAASTAPNLPKLPVVPEVSEQMPIKVLKQVEGGITAPHACALCGMKREERVAKVDLEVDDSFGEWWAPNLSMHLSCRNFWGESEKKLKSR